MRPNDVPGRPRHLLFTVTDAEVATFRDLKQQQEIQFAESTNACPGFRRCSTRAAIWTPSALTVQLFPLTPLGSHRGHADRRPARAGGARREVPLVLSLTYYGLYVLKSVEVQHRIFHNGVTMSAEIALNLTEYN